MITHENLPLLQELLNRQVALQKRIGCELQQLSQEEREKWTKENMIAIVAELVELLEWMNWKHWKKTKVVVTPERLKEIQMEIIDIFHFWMNLCIIWEMDAEKIKELYFEKNEINYKRQDAGY